MGEYTCGSTAGRLLEMLAATRDRSSFEKYLRFTGRSCGATEEYTALSFLERTNHAESLDAEKAKFLFQFQF